MTDDEKISTIIYSLKTHALGDIKRASEGGSKLGAFMLCSCLIDAMAGFIKGADSNREDYKNFVDNYLPNYNRDSLYHDLRCKLLHNYSEGGSYVFIHEQPALHLRPYPFDQRSYINLDNFLADVESALESLSSKLLEPSETMLRCNAVARYDQSNIIQVFTMPSIIINPPASGTK